MKSWRHPLNEGGVAADGLVRMFLLLYKLEGTPPRKKAEVVMNSIVAILGSPPVTRKLEECITKYETGRI